MSSKKVTVKLPECTPKKPDNKEMDWRKCILCQQESNDALVCPLNTTQKNVEKYVGYETIFQDIERFWNSGISPFKVNTCLIGSDNEGMSKLLCEKSAGYHKVCKNKICN